jgi:hypothetical protein
MGHRYEASTFWNFRELEVRRREPSQSPEIQSPDFMKEERGPFDHGIVRAIDLKVGRILTFRESEV